MKLFLRFCLLFLTTLGIANASTTLTINVTGFTGGTSPGASIRIDLQNCNGAQVAGTGEIVPQSQTVFPVSGSVTVTLFSNSDGAGGGQILCSTPQGLKPYSYYSFNFIYQGVITSIGSYNLLPGTYQLSNLTPCVGTACIGSGGAGGNGVSKIIGGAGITVSPGTGIGDVTVSTTGSSCSDCLVTDPAGNQNTSALNTVRYVNPSTSTDLGAEVNALWTACSQTCEVHIPAGTYTSSTTINMAYPTESLTGDGANKVSITYAGSTNFLTRRYASAQFNGGGFMASSVISGFLVTCSNSAVKCFLGGSTINAVLRDLVVVGPGGIVSSGSPGTSECFTFQNNYNWMERWKIQNVTCGGFSKNLHFLAPTGAGTNSYGYGLVDGMWTNQGAGSLGVVVDTGASVYNVLGFKYQINSGSTTTADEYFHIAGTFQGVGFHVTGENASASITPFHTTTTGLIKFEGDTNLFTNNPPISDTALCSGWPCIYIRPNVTINGIEGQVAGAGTLAAPDGHTYTVLPSDMMSGANPFEPSMFGFLNDATDGLSTPFAAFDPNSRYCIYSRPAGSSFSALNALTWKWCVDGSGNTTQPGGATLGGPLVATLTGTINQGNGSGPALTLNSTSTLGSHIAFNAALKNWKIGVEGSSETNGGYYYFNDVTDSTAPLALNSNTAFVTNLNVSGTCTGCGGGGGNPSIGSPGAVQSAGATTGTFADSGCTATSGAEVCVSVASTGVAGVGGGYDFTEGTASSAVSGHDIIQGTTAAHRVRVSNNGGSFVDFAEVATAGTSGHLAAFASNGIDLVDGGAPSGGLTNTTVSIGTTSIAGNTCTSASTATITGLASTSTINFTPNADAAAITGWGSVGGLTVDAWPTTNTVNYKICNQTASSITPGAITFNVSGK